MPITLKDVQDAMAEDKTKKYHENQASNTFIDFGKRLGEALLKWPMDTTAATARPSEKPEKPTPNKD